jgi:putative transposase
VKYAFIKDNCRSHAIRNLCRVIKVSPSGYYDWLKRGASKRSKQDLNLAIQIKRIHTESRSSYVKGSNRNLATFTL